jgi:Na+/proline symporter
MLNSTATIFTVDLYQRHLKPESSQRHLIFVGRTSTVVFLLLAAGWAPFLVRFERIFSYIQEFWGLITPGVAVVFLSGLFWKRATARGAVWVMGLTLPITIGVKWVTPNTAFLDQMWLAGIVLFVLLAGISLAWPEEERGSADGEKRATGEPAAGEASTGTRGEGARTPETPEAAIPERDLLFDLLSIGAVVATVALVLIFF